MSSESEERLCGIIENLFIRSGTSETEAKYFSLSAIDYMNGKSAALKKDIPVRLIKGGIYKIKEYYLENSNLSDIRGASAIITFVQEQVIPGAISAAFGFDCTLYNGGGNILALVPEEAERAFGEKLEAEAQKYLVTAYSAYLVSQPLLLSELLGKNYKAVISNVESELENRKGIKINLDGAPRSYLIGKEICGARIEAEESDKGAYCEKCGKRIALYKVRNIHICGGCLHKYLAGLNQKRIYAGEMNDYMSTEDPDYWQYSDDIEPVRTLKDIDEKQIAAVYADGNNMGGIVQSFTKLTDMMDFSDFVKSTIPEAVKHSILVNGGFNCEIVAMGGDDIFVIVPGKYAFGFSLSLINEYKERFGSKYGEGISTLSAGICIAGTGTPIRIMLEEAENKLSEAKRKSAVSEGCGGSLSYVILNAPQVNTTKSDSMLPFSVEEAEIFQKFFWEIKSRIHSRSKFRNIAKVFENAESADEAKLFLSYINEKEKNPQKRIRLPEINGYKLKNGYYEKDGRLYTFWKELSELMKLYWDDLYC